MKASQHYWSQSKYVIVALLTVWGLMSFGCSILWVDHLDKLSFFGFKFGFWIAQQGSILSFLAIIILYVWVMNRLDKKHGFFEE